VPRFPSTTRWTAADRAAGHRIACPLLVHWGAGDDGLSDDGPLPVWRRCADDVRGAPLPGGHFVAEEAAEELITSLGDFLGAIDPATSRRPRGRRR
jgi:haloacetate dehalogenase